MTGRACYFTVERHMGKERPQLYWDELPRAPIRNLVYVLRLDTLPNGERMTRAQLSALYAVFCRLREQGKLPPRWEPPPRPKAGGTTVRTGERFEHPRRHLPDLPLT